MQSAVEIGGSLKEWCLARTRWRVRHPRSISGHAFNRSFTDLRMSVRIRYQEAVDVKEFEPKIKRLLDDHVAAMAAETVIELVDFHDTGMLKAVVEETIREYRDKRRSEGDYLESVVEIASKVARGHEDRDMPAALRGNDHGMAFHGIFKGVLRDACGEPMEEDEAAGVALAVMEIIHERHIVCCR